MKSDRLMRLMMVLAVASLVAAPAAYACDLTDINSVDAIDGTFPANGGTIIASISDQEDESWMVFEAAAGDVVMIEYSSSADFRADLVSAVLRETTNGVVEVGDTLDIADWNSNNFGATGPDFEVVSMDNNSNGENYWPDDGGTYTQSVTIPETGQYVVVTAICNSGDTPPSSITISISGNSSIASVPALDFWALIGLAGILALTGGLVLKRF